MLLTSSHRLHSSFRCLLVVFFSLGLFAAVRAGDFEWQWLSPAPTANALTQLSYQNGRFLALGAAGTVLSSPDGTTWASHPTPSTFDLAEIVYGHGRYVLSDKQSGLFSSSDLTTWTTHTASVALAWTGTRSAYLAFGNGTFVRIQSNTSAYWEKKNQADVSTDGLDWHQVQIPAIDYYPTGLVFSVNRFYTTYAYGGLYSSPDGEVWTKLTVPDGHLSPAALAAGGGRLVVAFAETSCVTSTDGLTWTAAHADAPVLDRLRFVDGRFLGRQKTNGACFESTDGVTWAPTATFPAALDPFSVVHTADTFVARSTATVPTLLRSTDGLTWTSVQSHLDPAPAPGAQIAYGNGVFLAPGFRSTDGLHWSTDPFVPAGSTSQPALLGFFRDRFYFAAAGQLSTSSGGRTGRTIFTSSDPGETFGPPLAALGKYLIPATHGALSSSDGETWTRDPALTALTFGVTYGYGLFVRSHGTELDTSPDGVTWTNRFSVGGSYPYTGTSESLGRPLYGNGRFIVPVAWTNSHGHRGQYLITSGNGLTWTSPSSYPPLDHTALTFIHDRFVSQTLPADLAAASPHGPTLLPNPQFNVSYDGLTWASYPMPTSAHVTSFAGSQDLFLASTADGLLFTSFPPPILPAPAPISTSGSPALKRSDTVTLTAAATGTPPFTYQWRRDGTLITGANRPTLLAAEPGAYDVVITNAAGSATSTPLIVAMDDAWLANVSSRAYVGTGEDVLIQGFVVRSQEADTALLARAIGPSLAPLGVHDVLADPSLELYPQGSPTALARNDNWTDDGQQTAAENLFAQLGAFGLPATSKDAALVTHLASGGYSFPISGAQGGTGVALSELYDASACGRIVNLSARARVGTGDRTLIAGFVVAGGKPLKLLIRAVGPALAAQGVAHPLVNPVINLYHSGTLLHNNDRWGDASNLADLRAATTTVGAFALQEGSDDAAMLETLAPGAYTVHVTSADASTGIALVEIYAVP